MHRLKSRLLMIDIRHQKEDVSKERSEVRSKSCRLQRLVIGSWMVDSPSDA